MEHAQLMRIANNMQGDPDLDARDLLARWIHECTDSDWWTPESADEGWSKEEWTDWAHPLINTIHYYPDNRQGYHVVWAINAIYNSQVTHDQAQAMVYGVQRAYYHEIGPKEFNL